MDPVVGIDRAFWYIFIVSAILLTGITLVMVYFTIRYRRSRHPQSADIRDNWKLELDRAEYWLGVGAQASQTVNSIIRKAREKGKAAEAAA